MRASSVRLAVAAGGVVSLLWAAPADRGEAADRRIMALPIGLSGVASYGKAPDGSLIYTMDVLGDFPAIAEAGFNFIHSSQFDYHPDLGPAHSDDAAQEYLDEAHKYGLKVMLSVYVDTTTAEGLAYSTSAIRQRVSRLHQHPALYAWWLYDEPDKPEYGVQPKDLLLAARTIRKVDKVHPIAIGTQGATDAEGSPVLPRFYPSFDINMPQWAISPIGSVFLPEYSQRMIEEQAALSDLSPPKSSIQHIFAYDLSRDPLICRGLPEDPSECTGGYPSREELRYLSYFSLLHGAHGTAFLSYRFRYHDNPDSPGDDISPTSPLAGGKKQWSAVSSVARELRDMTPVFLAAEARRHGLLDAKILDGQGRPVNEPEVDLRFKVKDHDGDHYLIMLSSASVEPPHQLSLELDSAVYPAAAITALPSGRKVALERRGDRLILTETLTSPHAVHVYRIAAARRRPAGEQP